MAPLDGDAPLYKENDEKKIISKFFNKSEQNQEEVREKNLTTKP